ncbi:MAG: type II secretion system F family protein [Planctomycetota bacterium]|nr:MAG: type II secretion system F family protein [Planctomycetota bacterium]
MQAFEYHALGRDGRAVVGELFAPTETELDRRLERDGLLLVRAKVVRSAARAQALALANDELVALTTQLSTVHSAGVPILDGLDSIGKRMRRPRGKELVAQLIAGLQAGQSLSEAMAQHPRTFSPVYRASVEAGEASGALDVVLQRLARYLEWMRGLRATAAQALVYPAILLAAISGLVVLLVTFVLPRIVRLFPAGQQELPAPTRLLLALSEFLAGNWTWLAPLGAAAAIATVYVGRRPAARRRWHGWLLQIPVLGAVARQIAVARFASTAATLQSAGCDAFTVLSVAARSCGNSALEAQFERVTHNVRAGQPISEALGREPGVDPLLVQMVAVGEKSGRLDECLERVVRYYDDEVPRAVKRCVSIAEPSILLASGALVAFILLAAVLPIFQLYDKIG